MPVPVRYPSGVNTAVRNSTMGNLPEPDRSKLSVYFNDFMTYAAGDWTVTVIGTGSNALVSGEPFGALRSTNSAADNDGVQAQLTTANFTLAAGKRAWFKARFKISDATQSDFIIGLAAIDTTLLGATDGAGVTDGIFFSKDDGDANLDVQCQKNATTGQTRAAAIATVADDTYLTVGWEYDGVNRCVYYVNDAMLGVLDASSTYLPDTSLSVSFGLLNGEAVAKNFTVDYLYAAIER
jgi:hypothetical protein